MKKRVQDVQDRELVRTVRDLRRELLSYSLFVVLFSFVLMAFTLGASFNFRDKVKEKVLLPEEKQLFQEIVTTDDTWDYLANHWAPNVFSPWSAPYRNDDLRTILIGAVQLQQARG